MKNKKMKSFLSIVLAMAMVLALSACKSDDSGNLSDYTSDYSEESGGISAIVVESSAQDGKGDGAGDATGNSNGTSGGKGNASSSQSSAWKAVLSKMPSDLKGTTIEFFNWNPVSEYPQMSSLIKNFQKETGMKVKWTIGSYENYCVELATRVAADNAPDIVRFKFMNVSEMELTQPISNSGFDFSGAEWDKDLMNYYSLNGKAYATNMTNTFINSPYLMTYNKDLIAMGDYEDPYTLWKKGKWTWDKFIEMCEDYYKSTKNTAWVVYCYDSWLRLNGIQGILSYENGKFGNNLNSAKTIEGYKKAYEYNTNGVAETSWDSDGFNSGKHLFMENMAIHLRTSNPYFAALKAEGKLGVVPYPTIEGNSTQYIPIGEYEAYGFPKGAKNIKGAPYFLRYVLDAENYDSKTYFFSAQALEVYQYVMAQPNRVVHTRYPDGSFKKSDIDPYHGGIDGKEPSQLTTYIDKHKGGIDDYVKKLNNRLNKIG